MIHQDYSSESDESIAVRTFLIIIKCVQVQFICLENDSTIQNINYLRQTAVILKILNSVMRRYLG